MATFKAGDKVKRIKTPDGYGMRVGATGVVVGHRSYGDIVVLEDGTAHEWGCYPWTLAPLTDPGADAFMERIKRMVPSGVEGPKVERAKEGA